MTTIPITQRGAEKRIKERRRLKTVQRSALIGAIAEACVGEHAGHGPVLPFAFYRVHHV